MIHFGVVYMTEFGRAIREIRKERGLTLEELAKILGTTKGVLSRYESTDRSPKISRVIEWATILGVPTSRLSGPDAKSSTQNVLSPIQGVIVPDLQTVPVLTRFEDGHAVFDDVAQIIRTVCDFVIRCPDNTMEPELLEGDLVLIRAQTDVTDGSIGAVIVGDDVVLRRIYHVETDLMITANSTKPVIIHRDDPVLIKILGLAVGFQREIKPA